MADRAGEAVIIRNDEAINLPANARVIYMGDFNITTSGEASYQTILSNSAPNGVAQGQGFDPLNLSDNTNIDWGVNTIDPTILAAETESAADLRYRDDLQVMTSNVLFGVAGRAGVRSRNVSRIWEQWHNPLLRQCGFRFRYRTE